MTWEFFAVWAIGAVIVTMVANSKGRHPVPWFLYGALCWPIALTAALLLKPLDWGDAWRLHKEQISLATARERVERKLRERGVRV